MKNIRVAYAQFWVIWMIDEKALIKGLEKLTDIYRDKLSKAETRELRNYLNGAIGAMIDVTDIIQNWPKVEVES